MDRQHGRSVGRTDIKRRWTLINGINRVTPKTWHTTEVMSITERRGSDKRPTIDKLCFNVKIDNCKTEIEIPTKESRPDKISFFEYLCMYICISIWYMYRNVWPIDLLKGHYCDIIRNKPNGGSTISGYKMWKRQLKAIPW